MKNKQNFKRVKKVCKINFFYDKNIIGGIFIARCTQERMSDVKKITISGLIKEYYIQMAVDTQEALKDLLGDTIQGMMETELDEHQGYEKYERSDNPDCRNGAKLKIKKFLRRNID